MDTLSTRAKFQGPSLKNGVDVWTSERKTCENCAVALITQFQYSLRSTLGDKYELILALRGQVFEYLRETSNRRSLGYLQSARSEKK